MAESIERLGSQAEVFSVLMVRQKISQTALAERLQVSRQRVNDVVRGRSELGSDTYRVWLAALGYEPMYGAKERTP